MPHKWLVTISQELGLVSLYRAHYNVKILCAQRFVRLFAYGCTTLILASYLSILGNPDDRIGLFMTLTIFGDVFISFFLSLFADSIGRRLVLGAGAILMAGSGLVFGLSNSYWVLLVAAVIGVVSASGGDIGPFRALEASMLAHLVEPDDRGHIFAWYALFASAGTALGHFTCGLVTAHLQSTGWDVLDAYRFVFYGYAFLGILKLLLVFCLDSGVELEKKPLAVGREEERPLLSPATDDSPRRLLPKLSRETQKSAAILCVLFALDSLGSGLAPLSWITYFFKRKFHIPDGVLGSIFFASSMVTALSQLGAAAFAKRVGNVNAMVMTHMPSAIALALIPLPDQEALAITLLILRACTQSMDNAPRAAFLASILHSEERTAVLGLFNVASTLSQSIGPVATGVFAEKGLFWLAFALAGCAKLLYDMGLLASYRWLRKTEV